MTSGRSGTAAGGSPSTWQRVRGPALLGALAVGLLLGVRASLGRLDALDPGQVPGRWATAAALVLLLAGQVVVGYGWRWLVPALRDPVASMWTFHVTQPGKYLPLGVGQAVGQVALVRELGLPLRRAMAAWASHIAMIVAGGVTTAVLLVFHPGLGPLRWVAVACLAGALAVRRPVLQRVVGAGGRFTRRLPEPTDLPDQRPLLEAFGAGVGFVVLHGLAFAVLLGDGAHGVAGTLGLVGAYALAVGLSTATPLPAGLGLREGLLVLLAGADPAATIAAAVVLRVSAFAVEVGLFALFSALRGARRPRRAPTAPSSPATPG